MGTHGVEGIGTRIKLALIGKGGPKSPGFFHGVEGMEVRECEWAWMEMDEEERP